MRSLPRSEWIAHHVPRPAATVRLLCLPFAGGSATVYREWPRLMGHAIEICPIELPGRGMRFGQPLAEDLTPLVRTMVADLGAVFTEPYALFGHSMGAVIALELARRASAPPLHLFVSAAPAPHCERTTPRPASDEELVEWMSKLGGTPPELFSNRELLEVTLPILRADLDLLDPPVTGPVSKIACPLTAFAGTRDSDVAQDAVGAWAEYTKGSFRAVPIEGDHFFVTDPRARTDVLREIAHALGTAT